jgi:hypothetical protein
MSCVRFLALLAVVHALAGCYSWGPQRQIGRSERPKRLLATLSDGRQVVVRDPRVQGDSLVGDTLVSLYESASAKWARGHPARRRRLGVHAQLLAGEDGAPSRRDRRFSGNTGCRIARLHRQPMMGCLLPLALGSEVPVVSCGWRARCPTLRPMSSGRPFRGRG